MKDDLKDMVLSTLAEIGEYETETDLLKKQQKQDEKQRDLRLELDPNEKSEAEIRSIQTSNILEKSEFFKGKIGTSSTSKTNNSQKVENREVPEQQSEIEFLFAIKERMEVLFEGLKQSENRHIETKLNLTLSFLEYSLLKIDERLGQN